MPLAQVQDAIGGFVKGCKEFGISFANERPTIYHAGNVQDVKAQFVNACKKAGYSPQTPPELVVTYVSSVLSFPLEQRSLRHSCVDKALQAISTTP
jgi:eukaryotic translation initiation factor 2C